MRRFGIVLVAAVAFLPSSPSADAARRPLPPEGPAGQVVTDVAPNALQIYNDYATPAQAYAARRAVVHYVVVGIDAPPLNDDDANGVPDYVEHVGAAAD